MLTEIAHKLTTNGQMLSTVESCTGGGIAAFCTDIAGSSQWFSGGLVTYSNEMKINLGVPNSLINTNGAVSEQVVRAMAESGRLYCKSDWSIAVTGIAGPDGGSELKPVGTVWFAWCNTAQIVSEMKVFEGDRASIRRQTTLYALEKLNHLMK